MISICEAQTPMGGHPLQWPVFNFQDEDLQLFSKWMQNSTPRSSGMRGTVLPWRLAWQRSGRWGWMTDCRRTLACSPSSMVIPQNSGCPLKILLKGKKQRHQPALFKGNQYPEDICWAAVNRMIWHKWDIYILCHYRVVRHDSRSKRFRRSLHRRLLAIPAKSFHCK